MPPPLAEQQLAELMVLQQFFLKSMRLLDMFRTMSIEGSLDRGYLFDVARELTSEAFYRVKLR